MKRRPKQDWAWASVQMPVPRPVTALPTFPDPDAFHALVQAMQAGAPQTFPMAGAPMKIESLETHLQNVKFENKHIRLAKKLAK